MKVDLDTALDALGRVPSPLRWDDVTRREPATPPTPLRPHRPRALAAAVAAAALVLLVALAAVVLATGDDGDQVHTEPGPSTTSSPPPTASTSTTPTTPTTVGPTTTAPGDTIPARASSRGQTVTTAVTDDTYVVWGGEDGTSELDRVDGFAVDLETGSVSTIPEAPIARSGGGGGAWTGTELVVWSANPPGCGPCTAPAPGAAAWDPVERTWRTVAAPPSEAVNPLGGVVWAGDRIVVVGPEAAASYDPAADAWSTVPALPDVWATGPSPQLVWTGEEVVAWTPNGFGGGPYGPEVGSVLADRGWRWRPGQAEWAPLPDLPFGQRTTQASIVWTGDEILVWGLATGGNGTTGVGVGATWEPGDQGWSPMSASPQSPADGFEGTDGSQSVAADLISERVFVVPLDLGDGVGERDAYLYDPGTDTWALGVPGYTGHAPTISFHDSRILRPDATSPLIGPI